MRFPWANAVYMFLLQQRKRVKESSQCPNLLWRRDSVPCLTLKSFRMDVIASGSRLSASSPYRKRKQDADQRAWTRPQFWEFPLLSKRGTSRSAGPSEEPAWVYLSWPDLSAHARSFLTSVSLTGLTLRTSSDGLRSAMTVEESPLLNECRRYSAGEVRYIFLTLRCRPVWWKTEERYYP